ncbi:MAG: flavin reductase family protein [Desulfobacterales bacterium]|nr:flavin reductase family protein [Desulfobacterales bacterium]
MKEEYIKILGKMTYGIYVLTSAADQVINGMIASWVSQVSYDPLLLMAAIHPNRYTHDLINKNGYFVLNVISKRQKDFLQRFKGPNPKLKFSSVEWEKGITGAPILTDCIGYMECKVKETYAPGNHTLFVGQVVEAKFISDKTPLSTSDYEGIYSGKK